MANIYLGNTQLGGGGIVPTNTLPTANAENYDKHELYLNDGELKYLDKYYSDDFTYNSNVYNGQTSNEDEVNQSATVGTNIFFHQNGYIRKFDCVSKTVTYLVSDGGNLDFSWNGNAQVDGDYIYFIRDYQRITKYNYKTNTSESLTNTSSINRSCGSTIYNGYLYTFGGAGSSNSNIGYIYKYSLETGEKSRVGSLVITNGRNTITYRYGNIVYIFVTSTNNSWPTDNITNVIWKFDLTNETLTQTNLKLPVDISVFCVMDFNNLVYLVGGINSSHNYKGVITFNPETETFAQLTNTMTQMRYNCAFGKQGNVIYLNGGRTAPNAQTRYAQSLTFPEVIEYKTLASSDVVNTISFTITFTSPTSYTGTYQATEGMTWSEWVNSAYNTGSYEVYGTTIRRVTGAGTHTIDGATPSGTITNGRTYSTTFTSGGNND